MSTLVDRSYGTLSAQLSVRILKIQHLERTVFHVATAVHHTLRRMPERFRFIAGVLSMTLLIPKTAVTSLYGKQLGTTVRSLHTHTHTRTPLKFACFKNLNCVYAIIVIYSMYVYYYCYV